MTPADMIILVILAAVVAKVLLNLYKHKQTGSGCSGCGGCSSCPSCHNSERQPDDQE